MSNLENKDNKGIENGKSQFIKVNNKLFNLDYVKEIECTDTKCTFRMAEFYNNLIGETWECSKYRSPDCYKIVSKFIDDHQ